MDYNSGSRSFSHRLLSGAKELVGRAYIQTKTTVDSVTAMPSKEQTLSDYQTMTTYSFPDNPSNRKAVIVLPQHDIEKCAYEPGAAQLLLDEEAYVLQFPVRPHAEGSTALRNIIDAGLARAGTILIQSPFDPDVYEEASIATQRFALAKHMHFSMLCMYLGAKEVSVEQIDLRTKTGKISIDVKGEHSKIAGVKASVKTDAEELEHFRAQMNLLDEFTGGPPDVDAAERLLRRTGLLADPNMRSLIEMRREGTNQLLTRRLVLSLSSEARSNLNVVGRLKVPPFVKLSAEYDRLVSEHQDYTLTVLVRF